ncbi:MAG: hypothetical protein AB7I48_26160 [Planctomycetaceae bacterium]
MRWLYRAAFVIGMPVALVMSVIADITRQGAVVTVVATLPSAETVEVRCDGRNVSAPAPA